MNLREVVANIPSNGMIMTTSRRFRLVRICLALVAVAIVTSACSIPYPPCDLDAVRYPTGARLQGDSLRLGVINASPLFPSDLPRPLRQTQASIAVLDDVRWGRVEPEPPQNGIHTYQWDDESVALDTRVHAYQQAGFELVMVLRAWNTWARSVAPQGGLAAAGSIDAAKTGIPGGLRCLDRRRGRALRRRRHRRCA